MPRLLIAVALGLVAVPDASAKLCATVTVVPRAPAAGAEVEIRLGTWTPVWGPRARATFGGHETLSARSALVVHVMPPGSAPRAIRLRRDAERPWLWTRHTTLTTPGIWQFRPDARRWAYAPRTCARAARVRVQ